MRKPKRRPVLRSLVTADPWCWFAPSPLAPIDRFSKGTVSESRRSRVMPRSAPALLELALEHFAGDDRLHDLDRATRDLDDASIGIGAADQIGRASCRERGCQYV